MAVFQDRITVDQTRDQLDTHADSPMIRGSQSERGFDVAVKNKGDYSVFIGNETVTAANGYELEAGEQISFRLFGDDHLYGICATSESTLCHTITVGV